MTPDRVVFVRGLLRAARIGVLPSEHHAPQRIRIDVAFTVADPGGVGPDTLERAVDYRFAIEAVDDALGGGHIRLVETLAERVAEAMLTDPRIHAVTVKVEKLEILADGAVVGVEVRRGR